MQNIADAIIAKFPDLREAVKIQRPERIWVKVPYADFRKFLDFTVGELKINSFCMLTGLDDKENFSFIYHLGDDSALMLNIETSVPKTAPVIKTVTDLFPAAELQERELTDLLGVEIDGLDKSRRYPLPDDWPAGEYPLRKDWDESRLDGVYPPKEPKKEDCNG